MKHFDGREKHDPEHPGRFTHGGWIMFIVLLCWCWPLAWVPFFIDGLDARPKHENRGCGSSCMTPAKMAARP
jgi:hypothetical protein